MVSSRKKITLSKVRNAANELVYLWKREYSKCINNRPVPKPITIPQIAHKAGIAPKTIYTDKEYKSIALTAIAKTKLEEDEETIEFFVSKDKYTKEELTTIIRSVKRTQEEEKKVINKGLKESMEKIHNYKKKVDELNKTIEVQALKIADLENKNHIQEGQIKLLTQNL